MKTLVNRHFMILAGLILLINIATAQPTLPPFPNSPTNTGSNAPNSGGQNNTPVGGAISPNTYIVLNTLNSGAGSLRQAITDVNSNPLADSILFRIPKSDPGYDSVRGVFRITVNTIELPVISRSGLVIDGISQTRFSGNTNNAIYFTDTVTGSVNSPFSPINNPEIEIVDQNNLIYGLKINAPFVKIYGLCILGFGDLNSENTGNVVLQNAPFCLIYDNVTGIASHSFSLPDIGFQNNANNLVLINSDSCIIYRNLFAFGGLSGIFIKNSDNQIIHNNFVFQNGMLNPVFDGINIGFSNGSNVISNNIIKNNAANGIDLEQSIENNQIQFNTISSNGYLLSEKSGIRLFGENNLIKKNIINANTGSGILVVSNSTNNVITENSIFNNGAFPDSFNNISHAIGIDLITPSENQAIGLSPFYTLNDLNDFDIGANNLVNYPVILNAISSNSNIEISGYANSNSKIEFFIADTSSLKDYPQGKTFLFSATEGSVSDSDNSSGNYGPLAINGIFQGSDNTQKFRFVFPLPSGVNTGSILTATSTLANNTSEFCPAAIVDSASSLVTPFLNCIYSNGNGNYSAVFGYENPNNSMVSIPIGNLNYFTTSNQDQGQPSLFSPGINNMVFTTAFTSNISWKLNNTTITATTSSNKCPVDLQITKRLINVNVEKNDTAHFQIVVKNQSNFNTSDIIVADTLASMFTYVSSNANAGNYNASNHLWNISTLAMHDTAYLNIYAIVDTSGLNEAFIFNQFQPDLNMLNNSAFVSVTMSNSSGGNNGGLESNGNLASLVAYRNFMRHKEPDLQYDNPSKMQLFTEEDVISKNIKTSTIKNAQISDLINFIPQNGPSGSSAYISTPVDLIGISNAIEVFAVDYFVSGNEREAAILGIATTQGKVYEHTKMICDRLDGAVMEEVRHIEINGLPFIIAKLVQDDGKTDIAVSFIAYKNGNQYSIDNRWDLESYHPQGNHPVLNFQVWSTNETSTINLVKAIISKIQLSGYSVNYINQYPPVIPSVYVKSGYYKDGKLILTLKNKAQATSVYLKGNKAIVEDGSRYQLIHNAAIPQQTISSVEIPVGSIFDIGFTLSNNMMGGEDVLYYADGPWGVDYEEDGSVVISDFSINAQTAAYTSGAFNLEREAYLEASVKSYISVYKILRVGNKAINLNNYTALEFDAFGSGTFDLIISKKSITEWNKQYKTTVNLNYSNTTYHIPFSQLSNEFGIHNFSPDDVVSVVLTKKGNNVSFQNITLGVGNMKFVNAFTNISETKTNNTTQISAYPNPFSKNTNLNFNIKEASNVKIKIYSVDGTLVKELTNRFYNAGAHNYKINAESMEEGIYFVRLETETDISNCKIVIIK